MELKSVKSFSVNGEMFTKVSNVQDLESKTSSNENGYPKDGFDSDLNASQQCVGCCTEIKKHFKTAINIIALVTYLAYYGYAMYCHFGDEGSVRLTVFTVFGILLLTWRFLLGNTNLKSLFEGSSRAIKSAYFYGRRPRIIRWCLYIAWSSILIVFLVVNVAMKDISKLRSLLGIVAFILLMVAISKHKRKINWHTVFWGLALQFILGYLVTSSDEGSTVITWFTDRLQEFINYAKVGSVFAFGDNYADHKFVFQTAPTIVLFSSMIQVLIYFGIIQYIVSTLGKVVALCLDVSAPEAINACANILLGGAESTLIVVQYLDDMPISGLFAILTNGTASCAGVSLLLFISFGVPASYLMSASVMSVPAALICSKIMYPDVEPYLVDNKNEEIVVKVTSNDETGERGNDNAGFDKEKDDDAEKTEKSKNQNGGRSKRELSQPKTVIEALVVGSKKGMQLVGTLIGTIIVFLGVMEMADKTVEWFGDRVDVHITFKIMLSYVFYPFSYAMGIDSGDCLKAGELLGVRLISLSGVAYMTLGDIAANGVIFREYTSLYNDTWSYNGEDIFLEKWNQTLVGGVFSKRSELLTTYALCGNANVVTMGMAIGTVGALVPKRISDVSKVVVGTIISGTLASYMTACVAGVLV